MHPTYKILDTVPAYDTAIWADGRLVNRDAALLWSGDVPPPAIGAHVELYINARTSGTVVSYYVECGWLGLIVKLDMIPEWLAHQRAARKEPATAPVHVVGADLRPWATRD